MWCDIRILPTLQNSGVINGSSNLLLPCAAAASAQPLVSTNTFPPSLMNSSSNADPNHSNLTALPYTNGLFNALAAVNAATSINSSSAVHNVMLNGNMAAQASLHQPQHHFISTTSANNQAFYANGSSANSISTFPNTFPLTMSGIPLQRFPNHNLLKFIQNGQQNDDTSNHFRVFVGDLDPDLETQYLKDSFSLFGRVTECKIIKDMHTQKPKGYGFVAYATREEAAEAILKMNGQILGSRPIRTNWAVRKPANAQGQKQPLDYDAVYAASSIANSTVYVGGFTHELTEHLLRNAFSEFGDILEVRLFKEKGYAFLRFSNHESAAKSIVKMHGTLIGGQACKCSWGKESNENHSNSSQSSPSINVMSQQQQSVISQNVINMYGTYVPQDILNILPFHSTGHYLPSLQTLIQPSIFH